jgi:hypothetical protein
MYRYLKSVDKRADNLSFILLPQHDAVTSYSLRQQKRQGGYRHTLLRRATDRIEDDAHNSSFLTCIFVAAVTFLTWPLPKNINMQTQIDGKF